RKPGAGRKALLGQREDIILDWIMHSRAQKMKVSRKAVQDYARELARLQGCPDFKASCKWLARFMKKHNLVLRKTSTLAKLNDQEMAKRCLAFKDFIDTREWWGTVRDAECLSMDETPLYLGHHGRQTTVDVRGVATVPTNASGYDSTRMTCILAYNRTGQKLRPMLVAKGETGDVEEVDGVDVIYSPKA
ncbi:unnamed protein product, partial [Heterosigma akashiwo]